MLYVCLPTHNEAVTVGVLLWRLRTVLREQAESRDYEVVVYDDASTDATREVLAPYARVLPLTVIEGARRVGQSGAVDALLRHVAARSQAAATDAVVLMQADYTDPPEQLPELLRAFDGGADVVLTRRPPATEQSIGERRLRRLAPLLPAPLLRPAIADPAARDPAALVGFLRLLRVSVVRDALRTAGNAPLLTAPGWAGTIELAIRTAPFARRTERLDVPGRYDVRERASRLEWRRELRALGAVLWASRGAARRGASALDGTLRDAAARATTVDDVSPSATPTHDAPADDPPQDAPGIAPADPDAPARRGRRRRRGRSRQEAGTLAPEQAPHEREPESPEPAPADAPPPASPSVPDGASETPSTAAPEAGGDTPPPGTPARRRRRRGGARRGGRGPEQDSGVTPGNADVGPDGDPAVWRATPSDQPTP